MLQHFFIALSSLSSNSNRSSKAASEHVSDIADNPCDKEGNYMILAVSIECVPMVANCVVLSDGVNGDTRPEFASFPKPTARRHLADATRAPTGWPGRN